MEHEQHPDDRTGPRRSTQGESPYRETTSSTPSVAQRGESARVLPLRPRRTPSPTSQTRSVATAGREPLARLSPLPGSGHGEQPGLGPVALSRPDDSPKSSQQEGLSFDLEDPRARSPLGNVDSVRTHEPPTTIRPDAGSRLVRLSVRTALSRIDLALPEACTFAETLETVLDLCPQAFQDNAIAQGGLSLRTAVGRIPDGESTLATAGVLDGATLFLVGNDPGAGAVVFDDIADAVAETVRQDTSRWSSGASRAVAFGAAGLFAAVACLPLLLSGPPWVPISLVLASITVIAQIAAGALSRLVGEANTAVAAGLISVLTGAAAATVATAGSARLPAVGTAQLLLGAIGASVCACTAGADHRHSGRAAGRCHRRRSSDDHRSGLRCWSPHLVRELRGRRCRPVLGSDAVGAGRRPEMGQDDGGTGPDQH